MNTSSLPTTSPRSCLGTNLGFGAGSGASSEPPAGAKISAVRLGRGIGQEMSGLAGTCGSASLTAILPQNCDQTDVVSSTVFVFFTAWSASASSSITSVDANFELVSVLLVEDATKSLPNFLESSIAK